MNIIQHTRFCLSIYCGARRGFTIGLKRLKPRAPDFMGPQNFGSKDTFQHFSKQLYLNFCFGSTHVFTMPLTKDLCSRSRQICSIDESLAEKQKQQPQNQFVVSSTVQ